MTITLTNHALDKCRERRIPPAAIRLVLDRGETYAYSQDRVNGGYCRKLRLPVKDAELARLLSRRNKNTYLCAVINARYVITAYFEARGGRKRRAS